MTIKVRPEKFTKQLKPIDEHTEEANRHTSYTIDRLKNLGKVLVADSKAKLTPLCETEENTLDVPTSLMVQLQYPDQLKNFPCWDYTRKGKSHATK